MARIPRTAQECHLEDMPCVTQAPGQDLVAIVPRCLSGVEEEGIKLRSIGYADMVVSIGARGSAVDQRRTLMGVAIRFERTHLAFESLLEVDVGYNARNVSK